MFRRTCKLLIPLFVTLLLPTVASAAPATATDSTTMALQQAVNGHWRSPANQARDQYRHPVETLQFFGIKPDMTHDWLNYSQATLDAVFQAAFNVLKPGGVFGITEHRAKPFADAVDSSKALHRLPEDCLIALALKTGFRVAGVSEINANPNDPEDINVHRLPPDLAGPDSEHAKMKAIGESDRMTLRFVKP